MVEHLTSKVDALLNLLDLPDGANVLDIGCNDATLLNSYVNHKGQDINLYGVDPSSEKFRDSFHESIHLDVNFFDSSYQARHPDVLFHVITSIAMFYDIDDPLSFVDSISSILHPDGIWAFELSYLPLFLQQLSYDQICHEHVTYYGLTDLINLLQRSNLSVFKVELNDMNGGSIYLMCCHQSRLDSFAKESDTAFINELLLQERALSLPLTYDNFRWRLANHRDEIRQFFEQSKFSSSTVLGYGASTKGNILAHFCGITSSTLPLIGDINPEKHGRVTPGTRIPIVSHDDVKAHSPDYLFVFIWHFRNEIIELEMDFIQNGGRLVFPLPRLHIVDKNNVHLFRNQTFAAQAFDL
jgi:NDP-4-keto-2,6-dideoxyhexose 3-C-methyltransferase